MKWLLTQYANRYKTGSYRTSDKVGKKKHRSRNMSTFLRKSVKADKTARFAVAVIYLFITFTIPLSHTHRFDEAGSHPYSCETEAWARAGVLSERDNCKAQALSTHDLCIACVYLRNSKASEITSRSTVINTEIPISSQFLPRSRALKQYEWMSSILTRAPPVIIS